MADRSSAVTVLPGIGPARAAAFARLGLHTLGDLLTHYPRGYENRGSITTLSAAPADTKCALMLTIATVPTVHMIRRGMVLLKLRAFDESGTAELTFFNQSYVRDAIRPGESYILFGMVEGAGRGRQMTNPVFEPENRQKNTGCIMPVYPLTAGVSSNLLAGLVRQAMPAAAFLTDCIPEKVRRDYDLMGMTEAVENIHFPADPEELDRARRRMIFEELLLLTAGLELLKSRRVTGSGPRFSAAGAEDFCKLLPFAPTKAQKRAMGEIRADVLRCPYEPSGAG